MKHKINFSRRLMLLALAFFLLLPLSGVSARTFNPNNIITDQDLFSANSLTKTAVQKFLERENSVLARFSQIVNGKTLKASEMIINVSRQHNINPKFILTTLEKEQGLLSRSQATEKALDWATGYSCFNGGCNQRHQGFYNQIDATAETQQIYKQRAGQFGFRVGVETKTFDNYYVTPQNQATANLYIYTPHVGYAPELGITQRFGANKLFWRIWNRYFPEQKYLDGQVLTDGSNYWLIKKDKKNRFASRDVFLEDNSLNDAIRVSNTDLQAYEDGPVIYFANRTVVKSSASGQMFFIQNGTKRPLADNSVLALLSDVRIATISSEVKIVPDSQLDSYALGNLIFANSVYPQGKLFQDLSGEIWYVQDGLKHLVDPAVKQNRFANTSPETVNNSYLEDYVAGEPLKLKDGTFVIYDNKYYIITNGERMKIEDVEIFDRVFGLDKKNSALRISSVALNLHSAGEIIDYIDDTIQDSTVTNTSNTTSSSSNYGASFVGMQPVGLVLINGAEQSVTMHFKNTGSTAWEQDKVWLTVTDRKTSENIFDTADKIFLDQPSVDKDDIGSFTFTMTAPLNQTGLLSQDFELFYNKDNTPVKITSVGKFVIVKSGNAAQVVSHNLPIAVRDDWKPLNITLEIKNLSPDTSWLSRKTALEVYNIDGTPSDFYDKNDWVRREVAAVPVNEKVIEPGETGEFKFTIDPRGLEKGSHVLKFRLKLLDKDKEVYIDGSLGWDRVIRVD